ncbi:hypothetical protein HZ326_28991 [Fusarium oxysporum f. sp. albedinis]|nr:hypothetical protein HZ326_28991 [Fusarium oxysporum f. sp. albedinis]
MSLLPEFISNLPSDASRLNNFTTYLLKNHYLETFQFIQEASRYRAYYAEIELWKDLLGTYILPNRYREVNLPSAIRT